jgi:hypothetical protein
VNRFPKIKEAFTVKPKMIFVDHYFRPYQKKLYPKTTRQKKKKKKKKNLLAQLQVPSNS